MSRKIRQQLASIRRDVARDEVARMRAHVKGRRERLVALERERKTLEKSRRLERRTRLQQLRADLGRARKQPVAERRRMLTTIAAKRQAFAQWWASVRAERAARLDEIRSLRRELRAFSQQWPERKRLAVAAITAAIHKDLEGFDKQTEGELRSLQDLIAKARQDLKTEQYDLKSWIRNRRGDTKSTAKPIRRAQERKEELQHNIESNLVNAEELAWWRRNKAQILRDARAAGVTEGDAIAELIREAVDAEPERAVEFLQSDADKWLAAELRKQGYAA